MTNFLICGNDTQTINQFFSLKFENLQFFSTTENPADIKARVQSVSPDGFLYCTKSPSKETLELLKSAREEMKSAAEHFIAIASDEDLDAIFSAYGGTKIQDAIPLELGFEEVSKRVIKAANEIEQQKQQAQNDATDSNSALQEQAPQNFAASAQSSPQATAQAQFASNPFESNKKKILIVDDDVNILRAIKNFLQDKYSISVAQSGRVALKFLEEKSVDLIFLDYMMPEMDGPTVLSYIRKSFLTHKIPVVFLTGVSDREKIRQILGMNIQGYLLKPVESLKLLECVHKILKDG